ncbi:MAG: hypothetical protein ACT4PM_10310 [Gemmatimonadales bacterium]
MQDTHAAARTVQQDIHRRLTGPERLRLAGEMSDLARALAVARLRQLHPDWSPRELSRELLRSAFFPKPLPPGLP